LFPLSREKPIRNIVAEYFDAFSAKDLKRLSTLYADDVVLSEWNENVFTGKVAVLEENRKLFEQFKSIRIVVNNSGENNRTSVNEITVYLDDKKVKVVDSISVVGEKITNIMAYRGF
jgi:ketosteroid isomerase-like protein